MGATCAADNKVMPLGGVPPPPKATTNQVLEAVRLPGEPPSLGGKMRPPLVGQALKPESADLTEGTYVVREGDTLTGIAKRCLGDAERWQEIARLNPGVKAETLRVGQRLTVRAPLGKPEEKKP